MKINEQELKLNNCDEKVLELIKNENFLHSLQR